MFSYLNTTLEQFFLTVGQNNFGNKIPFHVSYVTKMNHISGKKIFFIRFHFFHFMYFITYTLFGIFLFTKKTHSFISKAGPCIRSLCQKLIIRNRKPNLKALPDQVSLLVRLCQGPSLYYVSNGLGGWKQVQKQASFSDVQFCIYADLTPFNWVDGWVRKSPKLC